MIHHSLIKTTWMTYYDFYAFHTKVELMKEQRMMIMDEDNMDEVPKCYTIH